MAQYNFGVGNMYATPVAGGAPIKFGALQDVSLDISGDLKQLYGQNQFPLAVARGKVKIEGKAMFANIDTNLYNQLFFQQTLTTGAVQRPVSGEAMVVPASPYSVSPANAGAGKFIMDLGVVYAATGAKLTQVASAPTQGQYTVSAAGVYLFAAADTLAGVLVDYIWNDTTATKGSTLSIGNALMGVAPPWQLVLNETFNTPAQTIVMLLYSCISSKLSLPFKQDDFTISEIDFQVQANAANQIGYISQTN